MISPYNSLNLRCGPRRIDAIYRYFIIINVVRHYIHCYLGKSFNNFDCFFTFEYFVPVDKFNGVLDRLGVSVFVFRYMIYDVYRALGDLT